MSKVFIEEETLIGIGNAIREKNGTTDLIATTDMATAISNLPTGGNGTLQVVKIPFEDVIFGSNGGSGGSGSFDQFQTDLSSYIGTTDNVPFIFSLSAGRGSTYPGTIIFYYDGNGSFTQLGTGPTSGNYITGVLSASKLSLSNGVFSSSMFSGMNNMMVLNPGWFLIYAG